MLDDTAEVVPSIDELSRFMIVAASSKRKRVRMMCWLVLCTGRSDKQSCIDIFFATLLSCVSELLITITTTNQHNRRVIETG